MSARGASALTGAARALFPGAGDVGVACYHCGAPVPRGGDLTADIDGAPRPMCCPGCQAVARAIVTAGLADYYRFRTEPARAAAMPPGALAREARAYDDPSVQESFVRNRGETVREASLILEGVTCPACLWLNERHLRSLPGVLDAQVNYATRRARVTWDGARLRLSEILEAVHRIGYRAHPYDPARREQLLEGERREQLKRIGVAGVLGMQVMMIAVALYFGAFSGIEAQYRALLRGISLIFSVPVVIYCARPFFAGAWRDLRLGRTGMDVPIALGIGLAFCASAWSTLTGTGEVYFDSVVMFVFFLLVARYFELAARRHSAQATEALVHPAPMTATRLTASAQETVPVAELRPGDRILVRPGETVPADGRVVAGCSSVDEALLTGESRPVLRRTGDELTGGSVNGESPLTVRVERVGAQSVLSRILDLAERAQSQRPQLAHLADRMAGVFVSAVLVLALGVALYWWDAGSGQWLSVTLAVLVATCPCALSLATPAAISAATGGLMRHGLVITRPRALEGLARATHFVFDKTGTLTSGELRLVQTRRCSEMSAVRCRRIAAALEAHSEHPVARALTTAAAGDAQATLVAHNVRSIPGAGVRGRVGGREYLLGTEHFVHAHTGLALGPGDAALLDGGEHTVVLLADSARIHCALLLNDEVRPGARELVEALMHDGKAVTLLSGDHEGAVRHAAARIGITDLAWGLRPADKVERVRRLQTAGAVVAAVGDGVNDAPVLAGADVSLAMGSGAQLARASADAILLSGRPLDLLAGSRIARRSARVIRQNMAWALAYNLIALSAAASGHLAPWLAALGMSASSLVVVGNAMRLSGRRNPRGASWTSSTS